MHFGRFRLLVESHDPETLQRLKTDLSLCETHLPALHSNLSGEVVYRLQLNNVPSRAGKYGVFRFRDFRVSSLGSKRKIYYQDGSSISTNRKKRITQIHAQNSTRLFELAYLFILSYLGEELDALGFHRVHGLGIVSPTTQVNLLFVMDSGVGKSTLALSLEKYFRPGEFEIFSDEIPLLKRETLHAFPIRSAFSQETLDLFQIDRTKLTPFKRLNYSTKYLRSLDQTAPVASPSELTYLVFCSRNAELKKPSVKPLSQAKAFFSLWKCCVVGVGVPQMAEHFFRLDFHSFLKLARIGMSRLRTAMYASKHIPSLHFTLTHNAKANAHLVKVLLEHMSVEAVPSRGIGEKPLFTSAPNRRADFPSDNIFFDDPSL